MIDVGMVAYTYISHMHSVVIYLPIYSLTINKIEKAFEAFFHAATDVSLSYSQLAGGHASVHLGVHLHDVYAHGKADSSFHTHTHTHAHTCTRTHTHTNTSIYVQLDLYAMLQYIRFFVWQYTCIPLYVHIRQTNESHIRPCACMFHRGYSRAGACAGSSFAKFEICQYIHVHEYLRSDLLYARMLIHSTLKRTLHHA